MSVSISMPGFLLMNFINIASLGYSLMTISFLCSLGSPNKLPGVSLSWIRTWHRDSLSALPALTIKGTPSHLSLLMNIRMLENVGDLESLGTPGSSIYLRNKAILCICILLIYLIDSCCFNLFCIVLLCFISTLLKFGYWKYALAWITVAEL